jgi:putative oxidoreductase
VFLVSVIIQGVLALAFLVAGVTKVIGVPAVVANFRDNFHFPRWIVTVTGIVECIGAVGMVVGIWVPIVAFLAGGWLAVTMVGAVGTHLFRAHDAPVKALPALVLFLLSVAIVVMNEPTARHLLVAL